MAVHRRRKAVHSRRKNRATSKTTKQVAKSKAKSSKVKAASKAASATLTVERKHQIHLVLPAGEHKVVGPYVSRRAALIDAKEIVRKMASKVTAATGERPKVVTAKQKGLGDIGYGIEAHGKATAARVSNPKRRRKAAKKRKNSRSTKRRRNLQPQSFLGLKRGPARPPTTWTGMLKGRPNPVTGRKLNKAKHKAKHKRTRRSKR